MPEDRTLPRHLRTLSRRLDNLENKITFEDIEFWKANNVTKFLETLLEFQIEVLKDDWAQGSIARDEIEKSIGFVQGIETAVDKVRHLDIRKEDEIVDEENSY